MRCIDCDYVQAQFVAEALLDLFKFVLAEHAVVHEYRSEARRTLAVSERAIDEGGRDGRIDAAGERANGASMAHCFSHVGDGRVDEMLRSPSWLGTTDDEGEVAQNVRAGLSVAHFGMKLNGKQSLLGIFDGGDGVGRIR